MVWNEWQPGRGRQGKRKRKKQILFLLFGLVIIMLLAGCSGTGTVTPSPTVTCTPVIEPTIPSPPRNQPLNLKLDAVTFYSRYDELRNDPDLISSVGKSTAQSLYPPYNPQKTVADINQILEQNQAYINVQLVDIYQIDKNTTAKVIGSDYIFDEVEYYKVSGMTLVDGYTAPQNGNRITMYLVEGLRPGTFGGIAFTSSQSIRKYPQNTSFRNEVSLNYAGFVIPGAYQGFLPIATHELGHVLGLGHLNEVNIMKPLSGSDKFSEEQIRTIRDNIAVFQS